MLWVRAGVRTDTPMTSIFRIANWFMMIRMNVYNIYINDGSVGAGIRIRVRNSISLWN